jgi:hypothetical protein
MIAGEFHEPGRTLSKAIVHKLILPEVDAQLCEGVAEGAAKA